MCLGRFLGNLKNPLRQALPFSADAVESCASMALILPLGQQPPADREERKLIEKRQALALGSAIALGAAIRSIAIGQKNFDILVFALAVIVYVAVAATVVSWVTRLLPSGQASKAAGFSVGTALSSIVGCLFVGTLAYIVGWVFIISGLYDAIMGTKADPHSHLLQISVGAIGCLLLGLFGRSRNADNWPDRLLISVLLALVFALYGWFLTFSFGAAA